MRTVVVVGGSVIATAVAAVAGGSDRNYVGAIDSIAHLCYYYYYSRVPYRRLGKNRNFSDHETLISCIIPYYYYRAREGRGVRTGLSSTRASTSAELVEF